MTQKIAFITSTRADYGLIKPILTAVRASEAFQLQVIALGTHVSDAHGHTIDEINADGFTVDAALETLAAGDSGADIAASMGMATQKVAAALEELKPDLLIATGDRYEMLGAASAALVMGIPMAHLYGGDVTEGAYDDAIRHSLTKMAALHFCTNDISKQRIIQMGEAPERVHNVGSPALDTLHTMPKIEQAQLAEKFGFAWRDKNALITFHPVTRGEVSTGAQCDALLNGLSQLTEYGLIFTAPNADNEGQVVRARIEEYVAQHKHAYLVPSFGHVPYLNMLRYVDVVVGNSSSGLYEVPSFKIPTVNIGDRQHGRLKASSVIDCAAREEAILDAIHAAQQLDCSGAVNPYGDGHATQKIMQILQHAAPFEALLKKGFYDG